MEASSKTKSSVFSSWPQIQETDGIKKETEKKHMDNFFF